MLLAGVLYRGVARAIEADGPDEKIDVGIRGRHNCQRGVCCENGPDALCLSVNILAGQSFRSINHGTIASRPSSFPIFSQVESRNLSVCGSSVPGILSRPLSSSFPAHQFLWHNRLLVMKRGQNSPNSHLSSMWLMK